MVGPNRGFAEASQVKEMYAVLKKHNVDIIDSAQLYEGSEQLLGETDVVGQGFVVDSKVVGGWKAGSSTRSEVLTNCRESLKKLGMGEGKGKLDIYYIHAPDKEVHLEETCAGINDAYKEGMFERFGLSNYPAEEVQKIYDVCKKNGYVLPTVYQGNYSPVARKQETVLFPNLRKLGGFLTQTKEDIENGKGRFDKSTPIGKMYSTLYAKPSFLAALGDWEATARDAGASGAELAYRWVVFNSPLTKENGDACIVGVNRLKQLEDTLQMLEKGPLDKKTCERIDAIWKSIEHEAGVDNFSL